MFWECHVVASSIDKLLDQPSDQIRLQDLLDESDLIQECLNQNERLLDYLIQPNIMKELIGHVISVPDDGQFRNAHVVSELLSGDFQRIQDTLMNSEHLDLIYSFVCEDYTDSLISLNPILASYFARIIGTLIVRKPMEILNYFKSRETFKTDFIHHLDSTSIADILFRFVADSADQRSLTIQWYEEIHLMDDLMEEFRRTDSTSVQMNIGNLFSEFLRLAFDQQTALDTDFIITNASSMTERLLYGRNTDSIRDPSSLCDYDDQERSRNEMNDEKATPILLAERILSKSNFEQLFDAFIERPVLLANGCDFLDTVLELLSRHMANPLCIPLESLCADISHEEMSGGDERMQINDEEDTSAATKMRKTPTMGLANLAKDPLVRIYQNLLEAITPRLPHLINLLSLSNTISNSSNSDKLSRERLFIDQPLGSAKLNLIKFLSKLIRIISNDFTGDRIYEIFNSTQLFNTLLNLFRHHIYNNFLHTQVAAILRLVIHINATAVKQAGDIWTRTPLLENQGKQSLLIETNPLEFNHLETAISSTFHYTNRQSYKLLQSILNPSEVNLFERLFDQYEHHTSERNSPNANCARFQSPNSGHVAQILRCLRDYASNFDDYIFYLKSNQSEHDENENSSLSKRWEKILDELSDEEKKWSAMHLHERHNTDTFRTNSSNNSLGQNSNFNDSNEAHLRRQTFHTRSFGSSVAPCIDDDDDDESETLNIDDELMNSEQNNNERKVAEMKKISSEPQFPPVFDEQNLWFQQDRNDSKRFNIDQQEMNMKTAPDLPDLFEVHRKQSEKLASSTESTFEQLCSLRSGDNPSGPILYPLQSSSASSIRDEAISESDTFWQKNPIHFVKKHRGQVSNKYLVDSDSPSSDEEFDEYRSKSTRNITNPKKTSIRLVNDHAQDIQSNNVFEVFQQKSTIIQHIESMNSPAQEMITQENFPAPILSSTPEHLSNDDADIQTVLISMIENDRITVNVDDQEPDDSDLENNFSFLIAKGLIKPKSF